MTCYWDASDPMVASEQLQLYVIGYGKGTERID